MPSNETIASLKKTCAMARKKHLSFYYFAKAADGEPALLMGKASAVRKEQKDLAKKHRTRPVAQGIVKKADSGSGLTFELYKGKPSALKKALKTTFGGVPLLKAAGVEMHSKKVSLKDKVSGALKGGSSAFQKRADLLDAAIRDTDQTIKALASGGVTTAAYADRLEDICEDLETARGLSETDPKDAYTSLTPTKADIQKLSKELKDLQANLDQHRAEAASAHKAAQGRLSDAQKALARLKGVGYDADEETAAVNKAKLDLAGAQQRLQGEPLHVLGEARAIDTQLAALITAMGKKQKSLRMSLADGVEAKLKGNKRTRDRRTDMVLRALKLAETADAQLKQRGIQDSADARALKALQEGMRIIKKDTGTQRAYGRLSKLKDQISAYQARADAKLEAHRVLMVTLGELGSQLERARQRSAALDAEGRGVEGAATIIEGLLSRLVAAEDLAAAPKQAEAAAKKVAAEVARFQKQLDDKAVEGLSKEQQVLHRRVQEVLAFLAELEESERQLMLAIRTTDRQHQEALERITRTARSAEVIGAKDIKGATTTLKKARADAQKLHKTILKERSTLPKLHARYTARASAVDDLVKRAREKLALLGDARDTSREQAQLQAITNDQAKANQAYRADLKGAEAIVASAQKRAQQLCDALDRALLEDAVKIHSASRGETPPKEASLYARNFAAVHVRLRHAEALLKAAACADKAAILAELRGGVSTLEAPDKISDPLAALEALNQINSRILKTTELLEAQRGGIMRIEKTLETASLSTQRANKAIWERFVAFAIKEWSAENIYLWQAIDEGRLGSPKAKKAAYLQYVAPDATVDINASKEQKQACFPDGTFPTSKQLNSLEYWSQVHYEKLSAPLLINISDTFARFRLTLSEPIRAELSKSFLRDSGKVIAKWQQRLG